MGGGDALLKNKIMDVFAVARSPDDDEWTPWMVARCVMGSFSRMSVSFDWLDMFRVPFLIEWTRRFPQSFIAGVFAARMMGQSTNNYRPIIYVPCRSLKRAERMKRKIIRYIADLPYKKKVVKCHLNVLREPSDFNSVYIPYALGQYRALGYRCDLLSIDLWDKHRCCDIDIAVCVIPDRGLRDVEMYRYWSMLQVVSQFSLNQSRCIIDEFGETWSTVMSLHQYEEALADSLEKLSFTRGREAITSRDHWVSARLSAQDIYPRGKDIVHTLSSMCLGKLLVPNAPESAYRGLIDL